MVSRPGRWGVLEGTMMPRVRRGKKADGNATTIRKIEGKTGEEAENMGSLV